MASCAEPTFSERENFQFTRHPLCLGGEPSSLCTEDRKGACSKPVSLFAMFSFCVMCVARWLHTWLRSQHLGFESQHPATIVHKQRAASWPWYKKS